MPNHSPAPERAAGPSFRVLLTGSTGTVGSAVLELLAADSRFEVHTIVRRPQGSGGRWVEHVFDLSRDDFVGPVSRLEFDYIIDCAQPRYDEAGTWVHFGVDHLQKLEALCTRRTKRLIHTGGVWVFGNQPAGTSIDERTPLNPFVYARPGIPTLAHVVRPSGFPWVQLCLPSIVYGSRGPLVGIKDAVVRGASMVIDDPSIECSVIERTDLARAYLAVIEAGFAERLFVVAEPAAVPRLLLYGSVAEILGVPFSGKPRDAVSKGLSKEEFEVASASQPVNSRLIRMRTSWSNKFTFRTDVRNLLAF
jgi:nucleoside-diphosphate-sugar epimerase